MTGPFRNRPARFPFFTRPVRPELPGTTGSTVPKFEYRLRKRQGEVA